jgi:serine/threonine-protein kinase ULK2
LLEKLGQRGHEALKKEIEISTILNHKHIVRLYDTIKTEKNNYLIFEFCGGGDLKSYLTEKRRLSEPVAQRFMHQICSGLQYLYCQNIMHRDLKLQNILMTERFDSANLKLADFGLAKRQETKDDLFETICGTPIYMAPELQRHENYTEKADLWSLGIILYEMVTGMPPFIAKNREELKKAIERGRLVIPPDVKISPPCLNLIHCLLQNDVGTRIQWKDLFEHPFIKFDEKTFKAYYE